MLLPIPVGLLKMACSHMHSIFTRELQLQQADWLRRMKTVASCEREKTSSGRLHLDLICWDAFVGVCDIPDAHRPCADAV